MPRSMQSAYSSRKHIKLLLGTAALAAVVFVGIQPAVSAETIVEVEIRKFKFDPQEIVVEPGTKVRWINREKRQYHSVWFEALGEEAPPYIFPEETYERVFGEAGEFPYRCGPHPKMTGVVRVSN